MSEFMRSFTTNAPIRWGMLVKSWSTGRNYFDPDLPPPPLPRTVEELRQQCRDFGCEVELAPFVTGLAIMHYSKETLAIRLPPKELLEASEAHLAEGTYTLPDFYEEFLAPQTSPTTEGEIKRFHNARIGEYTVNSCG